ncbi:MAG: SRPBCC family protein [Bacteroidota bacterium]
MKFTMIFSLLAFSFLAFASAGLAKGKKKKRHIQIQKEVLIEGSLEDVYRQVVYLNNFPNWSPFYEADPDQKIEVKGTDGTVGAQYHWEGNKGKDLGYQEIKVIKPLEYVRMECDIQKPFTAQPVFEYSFEQVGDNVKVTQNFDLEVGKMDAFFMWMFGVKKKMEKTNARGLELLKQTVEQATE